MLTDTTGQKIRRSRAAIEKVLRDPVQVTASGPQDFSHVFDHDSCTTIMRVGLTARRCRYYVFQEHDTWEYREQERDRAIAKFLELSS